MSSAVVHQLRAARRQTAALEREVAALKGRVAEADREVTEADRAARKAQEHAGQISAAFVRMRVQNRGDIVSVTWSLSELEALSAPPVFFEHVARTMAQQIQHATRRGAGWEYRAERVGNE